MSRLVEGLYYVVGALIVIGFILWFTAPKEVTHAPVIKVEEHVTKEIELVKREIPKEVEVLEVEEEGFYNEALPLSKDLQGYLEEKCNEYGVPIEVALAVMKVESNFNPNVISSTNDYGLMQINGVNHEWLQNNLGELDFLNPYDSITAGVYMLGLLYDKYDDNHTVLMAYNFGEGGMRKAKNNGYYSSKYSRKVMKVKEEF